MPLQGEVFSGNEHHIAEGRHLQVQHLLVEGSQNALPFLAFIDANEVFLSFFVHVCDQIKVLALGNDRTVHCHAHTKHGVFDDTLSRQDFDVAIQTHCHE